MKHHNIIDTYFNNSLGFAEHKQVAVKVIDDRGNELLVIKEIKQQK